MVNGLDRFKLHFAAYSDRYVLIGGAASSVAMDELGLEFRTTKDLDIVLCVEALDRGFAEAFWNFVKNGGYDNRQKSTGKRLFYRFHKPQDPTFPAMLELFSRVPDALDIPKGAALTPIPIDEEVSSLSAILMNEDYYTFVMDNRTSIDGLSVVTAAALIPLKASAYLDLSRRQDEGETIDSKDIKKHKNDIFRLYSILDRTKTVALAASIRNDLQQALGKIAGDPPDLKLLNLGTMRPEQVYADLERIYALSIPRS